jgi:hypothetical protein
LKEYAVAFAQAFTNNPQVNLLQQQRMPLYSTCQFMEISKRLALARQEARGYGQWASDLSKKTFLAV